MQLPDGPGGFQEVVVQFSGWSGRFREVLVRVGLLSEGSGKFRCSFFVWPREVPAQVGSGRSNVWFWFTACGVFIFNFSVRRKYIDKLDWFKI